MLQKSTELFAGRTFLIQTLGVQFGSFGKPKTSKSSTNPSEPNILVLHLDYFGRQNDKPDQTTVNFGPRVLSRTLVIEVGETADQFFMGSFSCFLLFVSV